jgi:tetraacyldisaccharide 4'-kinase
MNRLIYVLLTPLSWIYRTAVVLRNRFYDNGIFTSYRFGIPLVSIGNITVGGTGKTPHTEYLIAMLNTDFRLAVLSRGYRRQSTGFQYVEVDDPVAKTGDESLQIKRKYPSVVVAVDADRVKGVRRLQTDYPALDLVLLDDAFQHRRITPSLNIVLIDRNRPVWNDSTLPAGRLRDCRSSLHRADIIVITKCPANMSQDEKQKCRDKLRRYNKPIYFSRFEYGQPRSASASEKHAFDWSNILAVAGIARPDFFFAQLGEQYPEAAIERMTFPDHHVFSEKDVRYILKKAESRTIVTTEKDCVRLASYFAEANERIPDSIYYIPVKVTIDDLHSFNTKIIAHVRTNKENGRLYQN